MALLGDNNLLTITRHDEYYIPSGDLFLLVEHVQFRIHKYFFERESKYFAKLSTPISPGTPLKGSGDGNAIVLENLTADEFARFLWVFYNRKYSIYEAETSDWESILTLAHRWTFPEVKNLAIRELEKKEMPDVKRIKLYHENEVDRTFLIPRYAALCERDTPLTFAEGCDLGMETTLMIARGREEARASRTASGARSPLTPTIHGADLHEFIRDLFQIGAESTTEAEASHIPGALPKPRTEPLIIPTGTATQPPVTLNTTPKTPPASRQQKETPAKPAAKGAAATKKGKAGTAGQQQTKTTSKPETPVQETTSSPVPPPAKEVKTTTATKEASEGANPEALVTSAATANGTDTTPLDSTPPLHITTDTTANGNGTTVADVKPSPSPFDALASAFGKGNGSASASMFGGMTSFGFGSSSNIE